MWTRWPPGADQVGWDARSRRRSRGRVRHHVVQVFIPHPEAKRGPQNRARFVPHIIERLNTDEFVDAFASGCGRYNEGVEVEGAGR